MIRLTEEKTLTIDEAAEFTRKSPQTIRKWTKAGFRGIVLESQRLGDEILTSLEAIQRFSDRITALDEPAKRPSETQSRAAAARKRIKAKHGI